jgi:transposase-like protein
MRPPGAQKGNSTTVPAGVVREAVAFYQAGHSLSEVAKRIRHHPTTIYKWLKDAGVPMRPRGHSKGSHGYPDYVAEVKRRLHGGETTAVIACRLRRVQASDFRIGEVSRFPDQAASCGS